MVKLSPQTPCADFRPQTIGTVTLSEVTPGNMTAIAPFKGQDAALSDALKAAHGMAAPKPNRTTGRDGARALWFGQRMVLLIGPAPDASLARHGAITDQSDAWAAVQLSGAGAREVLARMTPLDLRAGVFKRGHTARSDLKHMMASITRLDKDTWQIMVFRGFAETLLHDLQIAMQSVASRG